MSVRKPLSEEHRAKIKAGVLAAKAAGANIGGKGTKKPGSGARPGHLVSAETRVKISDTMTGQSYPPERGRARAEAYTQEERQLKAKNTFDGGQIAADFAAVLCPVGFIFDKHHVWFGHKISSIGRRSGHCRMDFAHVEAKVNIELDGPSHYKNTQNRKDFERDAILRSLGWKIIRIRL